MGENGAGKSTLVKMLAGAQPPDSGSLVIDGSPVALSRPEHATSAGISVIHQHFSLAPDLTVTENVFLGHELRVPPTGLLRRRAMRRRTREILAELQVDLAPDDRVGSLGVGQRQMVEVAKALRAEAWLVVDGRAHVGAQSPRARIALRARPASARREASGCCTSRIASRRSTQLASRAVVLRDGRFVPTTSRCAETPEPALIAMMVGRKIDQVFPHVDSDGGGARAAHPRPRRRAPAARGRRRRPRRARSSCSSA